MSPSMQNLTYENEFDVYENELTDEMYFDNNGFAQTRVDTEVMGNGMSKKRQFKYYW